MKDKVIVFPRSFENSPMSRELMVLQAQDLMARELFDDDDVDETCGAGEDNQAVVSYADFGRAY